MNTWNPTDDAPSSRWRSALESHRRLLVEHYNIWQMVQNDSQPGSRIHELSQTCRQNTQQMIQACTNLDSESSVMGAADEKPNSGSKNPPSPQTQDETATTKTAKAKTSNTASHTIIDPSELFMIDPTPTDFDLLLQQYESKTNKAKRSMSQREYAGAAVSGGGTPPSEPASTKRKKTKKPPSEDVRDSPADIAAAHRAFEHKVEIRLKQHEQERQRKLSKKRKRESNGSANGRSPVMPNDQDTHVTVEQEGQAQTDSPKQKRKRPKRTANKKEVHAQINNEKRSKSSDGSAAEKQAKRMKA